MPSGGAGASLAALGSSGGSASAIARALRAEEYSLLNRLRSILDDRAFVRQTRAEYPSLAFFANLSCGRWYVDGIRDAPPPPLPLSSSSAVAANASNEAPASDSSAKSASGSMATLAESCYFKSTDGHTHHWKFSTARLNTHVLQRIIAQQTASSRCAGALIVDSTRKGKRQPDSFSRTLPIWCAVWNRALARVKQRLAATGASATGSSDALSTGVAASSTEWNTELHLPLWVRSVELSKLR
jgi:tRNA A64-2'-O-ribosylphosphate transferase